MRHRYGSLFVLAFALALLATLPAAATEPAVDTGTAPSLEQVLEPEANQTPVEDVALDPARDRQLRQIRVCEPEEEAQCPAGCSCVVIRNAVRCFC